jgi:RNA polymerase sigma factor (sigma-70 family)
MLKCYHSNLQFHFHLKRNLLSRYKYQTLRPAYLRDHLYHIHRLDQEFIKSLVVIASGISRNSDPYELVNGVFEYLKKNWERYEEHPNLKAIAVLKMKGLFIDEIRKNKNLHNNLVNEEGSDIEIADTNQVDIVEHLEIKSDVSKTVKIIRTMGEKCREILMFAAEEMSMQEMQVATGVNSLGTVLSRLSNCRKELKERLSNAR